MQKSIQKSIQKSEKDTRKKGSAAAEENLDSRIHTVVRGRDGDVIAWVHAYRAGYFRFNWNPNLDVSLVLSGHLILHTEEGVTNLHEDDIAVINPNVGHAGMLQELDTTVLVLVISEAWLKRMTGFVPHFSADPGVWERYPESKRIVRECLAAIYKGRSEDGDGGSEGAAKDFAFEAGRFYAEAYLIRLMSELFARLDAADTGARDEEATDLQRKRCQSLLREVDRRFREDLTLAQLAEMQQLNPSYLSTYFAEHIGLSFHEYLTRKRLEYAVNLLNISDESVLDIAMDAGFPNVKSFHTACRKYLGITPARYRKEIETRGKINISGSSGLVRTDETVQRKTREYLAGSTIC